MNDLLKYFTDFTTNPKENSRKATSLIILVLFLAYAYTYFGVLIQENGIASSTLLIVIFLLIKAAIADFDVLYSGNPKKNKYVRAFQENFPSKYIMSKYNVDMQKAKSLWFIDIFNKWSREDHNMHCIWKMSLSRGFKCRMVYFIIVSFSFMALLSLVTIEIIYIINHNKIKFGIDTIDKYFIDHQNLTLPIIFTILCFFIYLTFLIINYPSKNNPKGCFLRFNEINQMSIDWLKKNIFNVDDFKNYE